MNVFIYSLLLIIPAALPVFLVYKLTKNYEKKNKDIINMFSIAFFIPFMNFILLWYSKIFNNNGTQLDAFLVGSIWLFIILPTLFAIVIFIPKKIFSYKKWALLTITLTGLIGWILIFTSFLLDNLSIIVELEEFRPTINYIKQYKNTHGIYPTNLKGNLPNSKSYSSYHYIIFNKGNDFKLSVGGSKNSISNYNYCSSTNFNGCSTDSKPPIIRHKLGDWIEEHVNID